MTATGKLLMFDPNDLVIVGVDTKDGEEHPRWDVRVRLPFDESLCRNIMTHGVLQPVIVHKVGTAYEVVDGRQRVLHAREAARRQDAAGDVPVKVPAVVRRGEDAQLFGVSRSANAHRRGDTPMTNARNAQRMLDLGATEGEVSIAFGVTLPTLADWLSLLDLAGPVRTAVDRGEVSASAAAVLATLPAAEQVAHLAQLREEGVKPTQDNLERRVRAAAGKAPYLSSKQRIDQATPILAALYYMVRVSAGEDVLEKIKELAVTLGRTAELENLIKGEG